MFLDLITYFSILKFVHMRIKLIILKNYKSRDLRVKLSYYVLKSVNKMGGNNVFTVNSMERRCDEEQKRDG